MANNSRIRFNPVTKEIEVEGTEEFVKTYFGKLQAMLSETADKKEQKAAQAPPRKKAKTVAKKKIGEKRITNTDKVVTLVKGSSEGISTAALKKKTGLAKEQIWYIVNRAAKVGKIRKIKQGLYGAVAAGQE